MFITSYFWYHLFPTFINWFSIWKVTMSSKSWQIVYSKQICYLKKKSSVQFNSVQSLSQVQLFATPWSAAYQASLSITNSRSLSKLMSIESVLQPSHPLSSPSPPAFNLSQHQGLFKWVSFLHLVAEVVEFQLQHQSFQWTFRTDFL